MTVSLDTGISTVNVHRPVRFSTTAVYEPADRFSK
jgi:hypothetical protein